MGSIAGVLAGIGHEVQTENLNKLAVEHEAHQHLANQMEEMAKNARPEFANDLLNAAFQIRTTPPGKKPPKEATDLKALMMRRLQQQVQNGSADVQVPINGAPQPPAPAPPAEAISSNIVPDESGAIPAPPNFLNTPWRDGATGGGSVQNIPPPPVNLQPEAEAPPPVSGLPSPGFASQGSSAPAPTVMNLPPPPVARKPNEFTMNGQQYGFYKNLPATPEEERAQQMADMNALAQEARSLGLTSASDIANFIRNKEVQHESRWASAGQGVIYNPADGSFRVAPAATSFHNVPAGASVIDSSGKIVFTAPKEVPPPTGAFNNALAAWKREHPGKEPTQKDIEAIQKTVTSQDDTPIPVVEGNNVVYRKRSDALGKSAPRTVYSDSGQAYTGGVQGNSLTPPPVVSNAAQETFAGLKNTIDQFNDVDRLLSDPKKYSTKGPLLGSITMAQYLHGGGAGLSPQEQELANRLSTLMTSQAFLNGGKQLTGTELQRFQYNTPTENDTLSNALTKVRTALDILKRQYNTRRSTLAPRQQGQIPSIDDATGSVEAPPGRIAFRDKATGRTGTVPADQFDPNTMERR